MRTYIFNCCSTLDTAWSACMKTSVKVEMISLYLWTSSTVSSVAWSPSSLCSSWTLLSLATRGFKSSIFARFPFSNDGFSSSSFSRNVKSQESGESWDLTKLTKRGLILLNCLKLILHYKENVILKPNFF